MADHRRVQIGEVWMAYQVSGDPGAPPLVLLHALGEDATNWDGVVAAFVRHWRVYALDLRGHGESDRPGDYSFELMRDDVLGFLDTLGLSRVDLVGHSMGGVVAYLLAEERPERVGRLVLEEVPPPFPRERTIPTRPDEPVPFDWAVVPAIKGQVDDPAPAWLERLGEISAPTLVVAGGPQSHVPQDQISEMARRIPDCQAVTIPAGHLVHDAMPGKFTETVMRFLRPAEVPGRSQGR
jgi:pimeloyl-ACP methyl ester carboxylesterase